MNIALKAFAEGKAEMGFWPAATMVYLYSLGGGLFEFILICLFAFSGAITFNLLNNVRKGLKRAQEWQTTRKKVGRPGVNSGNSAEDIAGMADAVLGYFPDNRIAWGIVLLGLILDVFGGGVLFMELVSIVAFQNNPDIAAVGLLSLPLLYISVVATILIWNLEE